MLEQRNIKIEPKPENTTIKEKKEEGGKNKAENKASIYIHKEEKTQMKHEAKT